MPIYNDYTELPLGLPAHVYTGQTPSSTQLAQSYQASLELKNIQVVVVLCSLEESMKVAKEDLVAWYKRKGIEVIHLPILDRSVPKLEELNVAVQQAYLKAIAGLNLLIHCKGGVGRTTLFGACFVKKVLGEGIDSGSKAIEWMGKRSDTLMPENAAQITFIDEFCQQKTEETPITQGKVEELGTTSEVDMTSLFSQMTSGKDSTDTDTDSRDSSPTNSPGLGRKINLPSENTSSITTPYAVHKGVMQILKNILSAKSYGIYPTKALMNRFNLVKQSLKIEKLF